MERKLTFLLNELLFSQTNKVFNSPSVAAMAITKRAMNGWKVWCFERAPGDWVLLDELRK